MRDCNHLTAKEKEGRIKTYHYSMRKAKKLTKENGKSLEENFRKIVEESRSDPNNLFNSSASTSSHYGSNQGGYLTSGGTTIGSSGVGMVSTVDLWNAAPHYAYPGYAIPAGYTPTNGNTRGAYDPTLGQYAAYNEHHLLSPPRSSATTPAHAFNYTPGKSSEASPARLPPGLAESS
jgi:hypothetical protein